MKKIQFLFAAAAIVLAGCTSDDLGVKVVTPVDESVPISFGSIGRGMTRADFTGAEAADRLGNRFVVAGKKGATTAATDGNVVFDNYLVVWEENTANTTESNSSNWEYVGKGLIPHASAKGITSQTIKYWDYSQAQYDFIAWSTGKKGVVYDPADIEAGKVYVSAIDPNAATTGAYTIQGSAADLAGCYIADLVTVKKADYGKKDANNPVTFRFRSLGTKVRIALYETVPGYSVKNVEFYSAAASNDASAAAAKLFTTTDNDIYTEGAFTIKFPTVDISDNTNPKYADNNQAHVTFGYTGTQSTVVDWGALNYTTAQESEKKGTKFLGRSSNTASYAGDANKNYYEFYLPNESGTNLNLRVNYTLESIDGSGEEIFVKGATAQVPSIYTQWKPGFAYTYIFKISDKTNGYTGAYDPTQPDNTTVNSEPAGLYPITFDAVVVNAEDTNQTQETITTVSTPSITTYQKGSTVVNDDEYQATTGAIFVTVNDGETASTPDLANGKLQTLTGKAAVYKLSENKTEAEVIDALQIPDDYPDPYTIKGRNGLGLKEVNSELTNEIKYGVDGNTINVGTNQALRFTAADAGTYAFVYTKAAPTTTYTEYENVTKAAGDVVTNLWRNFSLTDVTGDAKSGVTYMSKAADGTLTQETLFVGQGAGNLYTRTGDDPASYVYTAVATTYAATGGTYYYTTDGGATYKLAVNIDYAAFEGAELYTTTDGITYTQKPSTVKTPADGTAYYKNTGTDTAPEYTYCVILPQQVDGMYKYQYDPAGRYACMNPENALAGHGYFDKYVKNNGVYYTKVIKVQ